MTNRPVQGGPAVPVVIVGSEDAGGTPGFPAGGVPTYTAPATAATTTGVIAPATGAMVLAPNPRRDFWIQNLGTNALTVYLGTGANTTNLASYVLKGCAVAGDGSGGFVVDDEWKGAVSVAGTSPSLIAGQHL